jgi:ferric-dicitrate binding protein FerR (iron transport regulator)
MVLELSSEACLNMKEEIFWILLSKKLAGEASQAELLELAALLESNPEWRHASERLLEFWSATPHPPRSSQQTNDAYLFHIVRLKQEDPSFEMLEEVEQEVGQEVGQGFFISLWKQPKKIATYSFIVIALLFFSYQLVFNTTNSDSGVVAKNLNELTIHPGSKSKIVLPDGSQVWVNSGSKLSYASNFNGKLREVYLNGEAYFEVTKNAEKPFIVHTSGIDIKVLGTEFNVKAFDVEPTIEATLIRGSIEVLKKNDVNAGSVLLKPHEKLVYQKLLEKNYYAKTSLDKEIVKAAPADLKSLIIIKPISLSIPDSDIKETAWLKNKFVFEDETLANLAVRLERWYNIKINIQDPALSAYRVSGSFVDETAEQALNELKLLIPFNYKIKNNEFFIMK